MQIRSIGIDLGKTTFHLVALGERGKVVIRKKLSRSQLLVFTGNLPSSLVGLEACSGSHFLGRALEQQGHRVRLIPAQFVKPFLKSNKNDYLDAEAIAEAVERQNMRFVPIKTDDQLDLQALHRVRERLVSRRTAVINQVRAFLLERGIVYRKGPATLRRQMPSILENAEQALSARMRSLLALLWHEWKDLEEQIASLSGEIETICETDPACQRLRQIPGVGPLVASATVAAIGNGAAFRKGREFAAWLGLGACAVLNWRQGAAARHQQTRKPIPAKNVHSWRTRSGLATQTRRHNAGGVDGRIRSTRRQERADCRHGEQARTYSLGRAVQRRTLSCLRGCGLSKSKELPIRSATRNNLMKQQPNGVPENLWLINGRDDRAI